MEKEITIKFKYSNEGVRNETAEFLRKIRETYMDKDHLLKIEVIYVG